MSSDNLKKLKHPFKAHEVEWRINRHGINNGKPWAVAIPYITSRAVQDRLDDVFGLYGWQNHVKIITNKGFIAGISFKHEGEWITKWDGAEGNDANGMDLIKSGMSNSLKRAAVLLGVGRYLYDLDEFFVTCEITDSYKHPYGNVFRDKKNGNALIAWQDPTLPPMALPGFDIDQFICDMRNSKTNEELNAAYKLAKQACNLHQNKQFLEVANKVGAEKRAEFNDQAALRVGEDTETIKLWLRKQMETFALVPNSSATDSIFNATAKELDKRLKGTMVDGGPLHQNLLEGYKSRIAELNQEKENV